MARREREINIFNIAFLDVITGAMGAFVLLVVLLAPYVKKAQETPQQQQQQQEQDVQKTLDRAEQNMDQAAQTDNVEDLRRLLAKARADLAEARKELDALQQELDQARQQLQQAEAENEDLRKRLQQAIAEADQARQQVVDLKDTLDHSAPVPTAWAIVDVQALPTCGSIKFGRDYNTTPPTQMPAGFTNSEGGG